MNPLFTVVIPTYDRPAHLDRCLRSLAWQSCPPDRFEVIVVDDGSPTPLEPVVARWRDRLQVSLLRQANAGPATARNRGADAARGRYLAFTDDDCRPGRHWLQRLERAFATDPDRMIGGHTRNLLTRNACSTASQLIVDVVYAFYNADPARARFFASNNIAMPKAMFDALGGFDLGFFRAASEDREFCDRWSTRGFRMTYEPGVEIRHLHQLSLRKYWQQHFTYGRGALRYHQVRRVRGSGRMRDDMGFHWQLPRLVRAPLRRLRPGMAARVVLLLGVWQVANAAGFGYERWRPGSGRG